LSLAARNALEFAFVPVDVVGNYPAPSTVTPIRRLDNTAPTGAAVQSGASANNPTGSPTTTTLTVTFTEYMDTTIAPTLTLSGSGTSYTWTWNANLLGGVFTITV